MYNCVCLFKVLYWNDVTGKSEIEYGFCLTQSFVTAADYLENSLYKDNLLEIQHLELFDVCPNCSETTWNKLREDLGAI